MFYRTAKLQIKTTSGISTGILSSVYRFSSIICRAQTYLVTGFSRFHSRKTANGSAAAAIRRRRHSRRLRIFRTHNGIFALPSPHSAAYAGHSWKLPTGKTDFKRLPPFTICSPPKNPKSTGSKSRVVLGQGAFYTSLRLANLQRAPAPLPHSHLFFPTAVFRRKNCKTKRCRRFPLFLTCLR